MPATPTMSAEEVSQSLAALMMFQSVCRKDPTNQEAKKTVEDLGASLRIELMAWGLRAVDEEGRKGPKQTPASALPLDWSWMK